MKNHVKQTIFHEYEIKTIKIIPILTANKAGFNIEITHFNIRGKLSIIQCNVYL